MKYLYILSFLMIGSTAAMAQCYEDTHTPFKADAWLSCQTSTNPNPARPNSHWIMYDLGYEYVLDSTHFWNYNTWGDNDAGAKDVVIDYSLDGENWETLEIFVLDQASASYKYSGIAGPSFGNTPARYVLITALTNWGDEACTGLAEVRFGLDESIVSVNDPISPDIAIEITPNPTEDIANISIKASELPEHVGLYDLSGRLIAETRDVRAMNVSFSLKGLPGGIYFVKASVGDHVLTEKVIKIN